MQNFPNNTSSSRIKQLRKIANEDHVSLPLESEFYKYESNLTKEQKQIIISENKQNFKKSIAFAIENQAKQLEIWKSKKEAFLKRFLEKYLSNLSPKELSKLYKITDSHIKYINGEENEGLANLLLSYRYESSLDFFTNFFSNCILLPDISSQENFNSDMLNLFKNLEKKLQKETIIFWEINSEDILSLVHNTSHHAIKWWCYLNGLSNRFNYELSLWKENENPFTYSEKLNKIYYQFYFYKIWKKWLSREDMIGFLNNNFKKDQDWLYFIDSNLSINIYLRVRKREIDNSIDGTEKEYFNIEFFTEEREKLTTEEFLDNSLPLLERSSLLVLNKLYKTFWEYPEAKNYIDITTDILLMKSNWEELIADTYGWWDCKNLEWQKIKTTNSYSKNFNFKLDDLIISEKEKEELKLLIDIFSNSEYYITNWLELPKWTILYWPPWVWKTLFAKILANNTDAEIITINHSEIQSKYVWESEKNLKAKFNQAREFVKKWKKVIILLDEWDSLLAKRWEEKTYTEWIINVLLSEMDWFDETLSKNIFVLLLTNLIENIDPAVKRRFNKQIKFDLPTKENLKKILELNISKYNNELFSPDINLDKITAKLNKKSWWFVKNLMYNSVLWYLYNKKNVNSDLPPIWEDYIISMINFTEEKEAENNKKMWFGQ